MTDKQKLKHKQDHEHDGEVIKPSRFDAVGLGLVGLIEPKTLPRLAWVNTKTHSRFDDRKHAPGRKTEQVDAIHDCPAPVVPPYKNFSPVEEK